MQEKYGRPEKVEGHIFCMFSAQKNRSAVKLLRLLKAFETFVLMLSFPSAPSQSISQILCCSNNPHLNRLYYLLHTHTYSRISTEIIC